MNLKWVKGLSEEQRKILKQDLIIARPALERLYELLDAEHKEVISAMQNKNAFSLNWKHYQASLIGELNAIDKVKQLIKD